MQTITATDSMNRAYRAHADSKRPATFAKPGETQAAAIKRFMSAIKREKAIGRRNFPVFKPGMSTSEYVKLYEAFCSSQSGLICLGFWADLNLDPATLYAGESFDFAPIVEDVADDAPMPELIEAPIAKPLLAAEPEQIVEPAQAAPTVDPEAAALADACAVRFGTSDLQSCAHLPAFAAWHAETLAKIRGQTPALPVGGMAQDVDPIAWQIRAARSTAIYATPIVRIGVHEWCMVVYAHGTYIACTDHLWRRVDANAGRFFSSREWPAYNGNRPDDGLPKGTGTKVYEPNRAQIEQALADARSGIFPAWASEDIESTLRCGIDARAREAESLQILREQREMVARVKAKAAAAAEPEPIAAEPARVDPEPVACTPSPAVVEMRDDQPEDHDAAQAHHSPDPADPTHAAELAPRDRPGRAGAVSRAAGPRTDRRVGRPTAPRWVRHESNRIRGCDAVHRVCHAGSEAGSASHFRDIGVGRRRTVVPVRSIRRSSGRSLVRGALRCRIPAGPGSGALARRLRAVHCMGVP